MLSRPRKQKGRSRGGCMTCKIRRIRCDEKFSKTAKDPTTPSSCLNCSRTGRKCEGPAFVSYIVSDYGAGKLTTGPGLMTTKLSSRPLTRAREEELRAFDFYLRYAATSIAQGMDHDFWTRLLPQISEQDDTVRHALLAISTLHEHPVSSNLNSYSSDQFRAVSWYGLSVKRARTPPKLDATDEIRRLEDSILTCMLFAIVETQYCNASNALRLISQGLSLIKQYFARLSHSNASASPWMHDILPMFARQVMNIGIFRGEISPEYNELLRSLLPGSEKAPSTLTEARDSLYSLFHEAIPVAVMIARSEAAKGILEDDIVQQLRQQQTMILDQIEAWGKAMGVLSRTHLDANRRKALFHALLCLQKMIYMWIYWILSPPQNLAVQDPENVNAVLDHAEQALHHTPARIDGHGAVPVVMELGVISPVCFVLWSCRQDPSITERATSLLQRATECENMYVARLQADVVATLLGFEAGLCHGSGPETFVAEVLMHSYSWDQIVSDALNGVRRTREWSWEADQKHRSPSMSCSPVGMSVGTRIQSMRWNGVRDVFEHVIRLETTRASQSNKTPDTGAISSGLHTVLVTTFFMSSASVVHQHEARSVKQWKNRGLNSEDYVKRHVQIQFAPFMRRDMAYGRLYGQPSNS